MRTYRYQLGLALLTVCASACATEDVRAERAAIIDGVPSASGSHPETVFLVLDMTTCTGTLITPHVVLTAGHCIARETLSEMRVYFGEDPHSGAGTWIEDITYKLHHATGDIGAITLGQPGPATPIPFRRTPVTAANIGQPLFVVGFGDSNGDGAEFTKREGSTTLQALQGDALIMGGGAKPCYGDSGGPAFASWDGITEVAAVGSFVNPSNCLGAAGNVRTDLYAAWLDAYIADQDPPADPVPEDPDAGVEPNPDPEDEQADASGGCSTAGGPPGGAAALALALVLALRQRARRFLSPTGDALDNLHERATLAH